MTLWTDAMLSPGLARWLTQTFEGVDAYSAQRLSLVDAQDPSVFRAARAAGAVVLTKDDDFAREVAARGSPAVIWLRTGNGSTRALKPLLEQYLPAALDAIREGQTIVEIPPR